MRKIGESIADFVPIATDYSRGYDSDNGFDAYDEFQCREISYKYPRNANKLSNR